MTAIPPELADDPAQQFAHALPASVRRQLNQTARIIHLVRTGVHKHGWTVAQLVERCSGDLGVNPGGTITYRLERDCAGPPPSTATTTRTVPFCSPECKDNAGWVLDAAGLPDHRCPCRTPQEAAQ